MTKSDEDKVVTRLTIRGTEYPVRLRLYGRGGPESSSKFILDGVTAGRYNNEVDADSLADLYKKGMAATKAKTARISLPVQALSSHTVGANERGYGGKHRSYMRNGTIVGKHTGNGNLLIQWEDRSDVEQYTDGYGSREDLFRPMSAEDAARFAAIQDQQNDLSNEERRISDRYKYVDVKQSVEIEIEKKLAEDVDGD